MRCALNRWNSVMASSSLQNCQPLQRQSLRNHRGGFRLCAFKRSWRGVQAPATSAYSTAEVEAMKGVAIRAWTAVRDTYVDDTFNHQNWDSTLQKALDKISTVNSRDEAYGKLQAMLATLEDPYTRIMPPKEFESFQISKDGYVEGVGLLLGSDQRSGRLWVLSPIKGGPADRAGVLSGDELVQIDGQPIKGMDGEEAASRLRGRVGTSVTLGFCRQELGINDAVGVPLSASSEIKIKLLREKVVLSPVSMAILPDTMLNGHASRIGYIRISTFSESAAHDMEKVVRDMEQKDVNSYILDLHDNPDWSGLV
ncbi:hypothetical protein GOP47_0008189 [Adiantum capillus-veneris]|uniref:PDZ domain-containing protein n=1 Tax=Adiantum capillus-veneris TaxID=13818 RepID=A0A9D4UY91_ADICA|nr:hypothetical protein GOP47_0008189 [Adiantum capillus-veneris]